ncbi:LysR family transcriptional regulator [Legionella gratiana]|uniref:LysR family transcriptional regulator n=1 Tax=Legionella gratiana TaxID=45066 RepID=A0A378JD58_9GAMM|nr:LysR family transcriptional regulator [Legionella gratiana]KTD09034.1 LysR family transcriptional regulator [Legionella gratiana]STX45753.1 LysR family transcriptional regulator [Legionella gratiana]
MILLDPKLIAFEAIVKNGTVHGAAKMLFISQTAVTERLRILEQKMKTTLFIRSRQGMTLTLEGESLHRYCQRVIEMGGALLASIQGGGITSNIPIKIAGPSSIMRTRIIPQCQLVMSEFPLLVMTFQLDDNPDISPRLKSGEFDLIILQPKHASSEMICKPLNSEHYVLVCSPKWQHRTLNDILTHEKIIDFDAVDQMSHSYLEAFGLLSGIQTDRHFVNNTESLAQLLAAGFGYGVLTKEFAEPYIKSNTLYVLNQGRSFENLVSLAWYPRPEQPPYFSALIHAIQ